MGPKVTLVLSEGAQTLSAQTRSCEDAWVCVGAGLTLPQMCEWPELAPVLLVFHAC